MSAEEKRAENPLIVEMNIRAKKAWEQWTERFETRVHKQAETGVATHMKYAVERHRKAILLGSPAAAIPDIVETVLELEDRDRELLVARARIRRKPSEPDAIDRVLIEGIRAKKRAKLIWRMLKEQAEVSDEFEVAPDGELVRFRSSTRRAGVSGPSRSSQSIRLFHD